MFDEIPKSATDEMELQVLHLLRMYFYGKK
jgi:hypothetical protein